MTASSSTMPHWRLCSRMFELYLVSKLTSTNLSSFSTLQLSLKKRDGSAASWMLKEWTNLANIWVWNWENCTGKVFLPYQACFMEAKVSINGQKTYPHQIHPSLPLSLSSPRFSQRPLHLQLDTLPHQGSSGSQLLSIESFKVAIKLQARILICVLFFWLSNFITLTRVRFLARTKYESTLSLDAPLQDGNSNQHLKTFTKSSILSLSNNSPQITGNSKNKLNNGQHVVP